MHAGTLWINWTFLTCIVTRGYEDLSAYKVAKQYKTANGCPKCTADKAVDRNISTCTQMDVIGQTSPDKSTWWNVDLGDIYNVFNIRIQFKDYADYTMRQRGRFAGFSLYVSNTTDRHDGYLCYKDGPKLPPLDFDTDCTKHGRYIIFYNERLDSINYPVGYVPASVVTELCEVTVTGCRRLDVYGSSCDKLCTDNCPEPRCNISNGACYSCAPGWMGYFCKNKCPSGNYGFECMQKCVGHCKDNEPCNHINGTCSNGCLDGWIGVDCNTQCSPGRYGPRCLYSCTGQCLNDKACNITTGRCDAGCKPGYTGEMCDRGCENEDCKNQCNGYCLNGLPCNSTNGLCSNGCAPGYVGTFCNNTCSSGTYGRNCEQNCSAVCDGSICNYVDGSCPCKDGQNGYHYCNEKTTKTLEKESSNAGAIAGGVIGACVVLFVIAGILFVRLRNNTSRKSNKDTKTVGFSNMDETLIKPERKRADKNGNHNAQFNTETTEKVENKKTKSSKTSISIETLTNNFHGIRNTKLDEEYKAIPRGELHPCIEGKRQENLSKNKYTTIFPYDHSRIVLDTLANESDYINANYIEDVFGKKSYIATQGPKKSTVVDFWRMVWQENTRIIVCFTNTNEANSKKIAKYWPDHNDTKRNGNITIRCQTERIYAEHVIRHLRVHTNSDKTERDVFMFHYTQWPDHGVPESLSLVVFHRHVMKTAEEHPQGCIIVNCSGGTGRTGTFIALDALYKEGERTGKVNVPQYVEKMRNARMNMIQAEDQYKLVYMALLESFRGRPRAILSAKFLQEFQDSYSSRDAGKRCPIVVELEELLSMKKEYTQEDYKSGRSNILANYVPSVLPVECYICPLSNTKNKNTYYNAVSIQSFTITDRFISAQFPLPDYTEDFLRLVEAYYTPTIVSLCPLMEVESTSLWLPTKHESKTVGSFITAISEKSKTKTIARTNITLQHKGGGSMPVTILECRQWKENEIDNSNTLVDLIQDTKKEEMAYPDGRILILSSDGAKRCGPFCAVFNALEQMMMDEEVDLFTITRQLQTRRPEFLSSLEEYQLCYGAVAEYLQNDSVYANA